jgi:thiosulfate/3-mercaptopyruvate sulfurtransferase
MLSKVIIFQENVMDPSQIMIEADELKNIIHQSGLRIYDATIMFPIGLSPEEAAKMPTGYEQYQAGHIPGSAFLDHEKFTDSQSRYDLMLAADHVLEAAIGELGIGNSNQVIVYSSSGILATSTRAWWVLAYAGVDNVRILNGGLPAWKAAGGEIETEENSYPPAAFKASFRQGMFASIEEVQTAIQDPSVHVENALPQDLHDPEHIPNSVCVPLTLLTANWITISPVDKLRQKLPDRPKSERIITYCGGGIAATVNAVAYMMLGYQNVAVYDGSLYEWKGEGLHLESKS